jgi:P-type conjugative transfer protein TrbJ
MTRRLLVTAMTATIVSTPVSNAGVAVGLATEWTQLANNIQLVNQYIRQGAQLAEQIKLTIDAAKNIAQLPFQVFGPILAEISKLAGIVQGGRALAYSMAHLDAEFASRFKGWGYNAKAWYKDYRDWSQTSLDTTLGTLRAAGMQGEQLLSEQAVLDQLRAMAQTSDGRMRALQVANQILEQQTQQLMKLRQLMLADLQSKQAFQAAQIQKETAREANAEKFFTFDGRKGDGKSYQAGK